MYLSLDRTYCSLQPFSIFGPLGPKSVEWTALPYQFGNRGKQLIIINLLIASRTVVEAVNPKSELEPTSQSLTT